MENCKKYCKNYTEDYYIDDDNPFCPLCKAGFCMICNDDEEEDLAPDCYGFEPKEIQEDLQNENNNSPNVYYDTSMVWK